MTSAKRSVALPLLLLVGLLCVSSGNAQNVTTNGSGGAVIQPTNGTETSTNGSPAAPSVPPPSVMPGGGESPSPPPAASESCVSIKEALEAYDFLATFRSALGAAGMASALDDPGLSITVLAPTNSAFSSALDSLNLTADDLFADPALLRRILQLHIIPVPLDSSVFMSDTLTAPSLDFGSDLKVSTTGDVTTVVSGDTSASVVDLEVAGVCEPGEVYVITGVLLPSNITLPTAPESAAETVPAPFAAIVEAFPFLAPLFGGTPPAADGDAATGPFGPFFPADATFPPGFPFGAVAGEAPAAGAPAAGAVPGFPAFTAPGTGATPFTFPAFGGATPAAAAAPAGTAPAVPAASPFALFFPGATATGGDTPAPPFAALFAPFGTGATAAPAPGLTFPLLDTGAATPAGATPTVPGLFGGAPGLGAFFPAGFPGAAAAPAAP